MWFFVSRYTDIYYKKSRRHYTDDTICRWKIFLKNSVVILSDKLLIMHIKIYGINLHVLQFLKAIFAYKLTLVIGNIVCISAEQTSRLILLQNYLVLVCENFYGIACGDFQNITKFNRYYKTSERVNFSYYTCRFHD